MGNERRDLAREPGRSAPPRNGVHTRGTALLHGSPAGRDGGNRVVLRMHTRDRLALVVTSLGTIGTNVRQTLCKVRLSDGLGEQGRRRNIAGRCAPYADDGGYLAVHVERLLRNHAPVLQMGIPGFLYAPEIVSVVVAQAEVADHA